MTFLADDLLKFVAYYQRLSTSNAHAVPALTASSESLILQVTPCSQFSSTIITVSIAIVLSFEIQVHDMAIRTDVIQIINVNICALIAKTKRALLACFELSTFSQSTLEI